ncbi:MAG: hypothetical protein KTR25_04415 [Myxococcales bacterium]|nr:hypothetical protein [Myxococcales bacterium]
MESSDTYTNKGQANVVNPNATTYQTTIGPGSTSGRLYGSIRQPSAAFVGRTEDLEQLEKRLANREDGRISASIEGLAGFGKTELAIQLVHRLARKGSFPGGIYWLDAEHPDLLAQWGTDIAEQKEVGDLPLQDRAHAVLNDVSGASAPVLVVLDNVEDWAETKRPSPLPQGNHVQLLVTTRNRLLAAC